MKETKLTPKQRMKYDEIMAEMKAELETLPGSDGKKLSCQTGNQPYQEISKKYLTRLLAILEEK